MMKFLSGVKKAIWVRQILVTAWLCTGAAFADPGSSNQIRDVKVSREGAKTLVTIQGSSRPSYTAFRLESPKRLVIDIANGKVKGVPSLIEAHTGLVSGIAVSQYSIKGIPVARVMINFEEDVAYRVRISQDKLIATLQGAPDSNSNGKILEDDVSKEEQDSVKAEIEKLRQKADEAKVRTAKELKEAIVEIENAKQLKEQAKKESENALLEINKVKEAKQKANDELALYKKEILKRRQEADEAEKKAEEAARFLTKVKEEKEFLQRTGQINRSKQENIVSKEVEKYKAQAQKAEAFGLALKQQLEEIEHRLATATESRKNAEQALVKAEANAEALKKETLVQARVKTDAEIAAKKALAAYEKAATDYKQSSQDSKVELRKTLDQKQFELDRAKQDLKKIEIEKTKTAFDLDLARKELNDAKFRQEEIAGKTKADLAAAESKRLEAEKSAKLAEDKAKMANAAAEEAMRKLALFGKEAEEQKNALKTQAQAKLEAAKTKLALAEEAQKNALKKAEASAFEEKKRREELKRQLEETESRLAIATESKKNAEQALAQAQANAVAVKKEALAQAQAKNDAKIAAKKALVAYEKVTAEYNQVSQDRKAALRATFEQKQLELDQANRKLKQIEGEKVVTANDLDMARKELKSALDEVNRARLREEETIRRTQADAETARAKQLEAERLAKSAEKRAKDAAATAEVAGQRLAAHGKEMEEQKTAIRMQADKKVEAAQLKVEQTEQSRKAAVERLEAAQSKVYDLEAEVARASKLTTDLKSEWEKAEKRAIGAENLAENLDHELSSVQTRANNAESKLADVETKLKENREKTFLAENRVQEIQKQLSNANNVIADQRLKMEGMTAQNTAQKETIQENEKKPTQEELRLKRLAMMQGDKSSNKKETTEKLVENSSRILDIRFSNNDNVQKIILDMSGPLPYNTAVDENGNAVMTLTGASLAPNLERTLDVKDFDGAIEDVSSYSKDGEVKVEVDLTRYATNSVSRNGNSIEWTFSSKKTGDESNKESANKSSGPKGLESRVIASEDKSAYAYPFERTAGYTADSEKPSGKKRYTGRHIDLDFKDADIHNILRLLADVGQVNIITGDDVSGSVTIRMRDVAWDHALDVILNAKRLGMIREGNLIRVAPLEMLEKEREMEIARRKQKIALEPIETRLIPVSYATAAELQPRAADLLTERGTLSVDVRTNVMIARDTKGALNQIEALVRNLDTQTPQVLIESRIVEATSTYAREIGIQWGGDFTASPATANPTGLAFPSSLGVSGGATDNKTPVSGLTTFRSGQPNPNFGVNLPAAVGTGSGGALGITLGSIANNANLSLRLSAMEESGTLRILSSPKILTLDNREAHIEQGTLIPYSQISALGIQTAFKEAKLNLTVTPHVTADGSVLLQLRVMRDEPDFNNTGARGDPTILKREAQTELLVSDGHTAVIGGIFTRNSGISYKKVPFFADIPILGWLFKNRKNTDRRSEMLIFITPRIVNRAESIGQY